MQADAPSDEQPTSSDLPPALRTLTTQVGANADGSIASLTIGENRFETLDDLRKYLIGVVQDKDLPFDQAVIEADPVLRYEELMRVVDVFAGDEVNLTKLSFAQLGSSGVGL
jgi:hypothetical protein